MAPFVSFAATSPVNGEEKNALQSLSSPLAWRAGLT